MDEKLALKFLYIYMKFVSYPVAGDWLQVSIHDVAQCVDLWALGLLDYGYWSSPVENITPQTNLSAQWIMGR